MACALAVMVVGCGGESGGGSETASEAAMATEAATETEPATAPEAETEVEPAAEVEPETEPETETEAETEVATSTEPEAEAATDSDPESETEAELVWPEHLTEIIEKTRKRFGVPTATVEGCAVLPEDIVVVDVRLAEESAVSQLPGARLLSSESARETFLAKRHRRPVLVYCTAGWRSAEFTRDLREAGVEAYNLEGGICAWALHGEPLVDKGGEPTRRIHGYSEDWSDCVPEGYEAVGWGGAPPPTKTSGRRFRRPDDPSASLPQPGPAALTAGGRTNRPSSCVAGSC